MRKGESKNESKELSISKYSKDNLSKAQKDFNKWVKRIEKLREKTILTEESLARKNEYYTANIYPLNEELVVLNTRTVKLLFNFYRNTSKLSQRDMELMHEIMADHINVILDLSQKEPDDELKEIIAEVNQLSYEEMKKQSFEEAKDELMDFFDDMGVDIDPNIFHEGMSMEEIAKIMAEKRAEFEKVQEQQNEQKAKKKTKKQIEQEEKEKQKEAARNKDISAIYKQLVKAFHPDLEKDEALKKQKEDVMKEITVAYENNDLHALLKLEIEWMQKEENDINKLTDDKLAVYNEVLQEQAKSLQEEYDMMLNHPRYENLHRFVQIPSQILSLNLEREKKEIERGIIYLKELEVSLNSGRGLKTVKDLIKTQKAMSSPFNDRLFNEMMNQMFK